MMIILGVFMKKLVLNFYIHELIKKDTKILNWGVVHSEKEQFAS